MNKTEKTINYIMTVFLLAVIFTVGFFTVKENWRGFYKSVTRRSAIKAYLPEDPDILDNISARVSSLNAAINDGLWKKDELGYFNSSFQYALGKKMINTGATNMLTLPTGGLYDLPVYQDLTNQTDEIIAFADTLDIPFLFVYEHATTYGENKPINGYEEYDYGDRMSDEIVAPIKDAGIDLIDSRDVLSNLPYNETVLMTDQHWTSKAALIMTGVIAERLGLDIELFDIDNFDTKVYENKFLGKCGQKIGTKNIEPEDITLWYPKYDTHISRYSLKNGKEKEAEGSFYDAVIKWEKLRGDSWNTRAYGAYGLTEDFEYYHNENGKDMTLLVFRDSYSAPICAFLSLDVKDIYCVDMRKSSEYAQYYIDKYDPDYVIMAYSRQMLCNNIYDLMEGY